MLTIKKLVNAIYNDGATVEFKEPNKGTISSSTTCTRWEMKPQKRLLRDCPTSKNYQFYNYDLPCTGETTLQTAGVKMK